MCLPSWQQFNENACGNLSKKLEKRARGYFVVVVVSLYFLLLSDSKMEQIFDITTVVHIRGAIFTTVRAGFSLLSLKETLNSD